MLGDFDTGGQGVRVVQAFRRHSPDWEVRSMVKTAQYMNYPTDLPFRKREAEALYQWADVIHVRNHFADYDRLASQFGPKPVVYHGHGTKLRSNPAYWVREIKKRNAVAIVSTLDLYLLAPETFTWLPSPYPVDELTSMRGDAITTA
jgi:hypothetical protein